MGFIAHLGCSTSDVAPGPRADVSHGNAPCRKAFLLSQGMLKWMAGGNILMTEIPTKRATLQSQGQTEMGLGCPGDSAALWDQ